MVLNIFYSFLTSILTSSWDRWFGDMIFYSFPLVLTFFAYRSQNMALLYAFFYSLLYFSGKYDLGLMTILFFGTAYFTIFIFSKYEKSILIALIATTINLLFLSYLSKFPFSTYITILLAVVLYLTYFRK